MSDWEAWFGAALQEADLAVVVDRWLSESEGE